MNVPDVVDMAGGVRDVIASLGGVVLVVAGGALAFMAIRKGLRAAVVYLEMKAEYEADEEERLSRMRELDAAIERGDW